jgi:hypothetical protein
MCVPPPPFSWQTETIVITQRMLRVKQPEHTAMHKTTKITDPLLYSGLYSMDLTQQDQN